MKKPRLSLSTVTSVLTACLISATAVLPVASGDALPTSPTNPTAIDRWINPELRQEDSTATVLLELVDVPASITVGEELALKVRIRNSGDESVRASELRVTPKHADAEPGLAESRKILTGTPDQFPFVAKSVTVAEALGTTGEDAVIAPGDSVEFPLSIPTAPDDLAGFQFTSGGFFPVLVGVTENDIFQSSQRFLLSVADSPSAAGTAQKEPEETDKADSTTSEETPAVKSSPSELTIVYPITASVDIVPGETGSSAVTTPLILGSEALADQIAPGGRIDTLVNDYQEATSKNPEVASAACLALDPQLVETLGRMSEGYSVAETRPSVVSKKRRLRDSWSNDGSQVEMTPGKATDDAKRIINQLRALAASQCTVSLPWANTELNAVAETKNAWLMREAVLRGNDTLRSILNASPISNVVIPPTGYVTEPTAPALGWADEASLHKLVGKDGTIDDEWKLTQRAQARSEEQKTSHAAAKALGTAPTPIDPVTVMVADNTLWQTPTVAQFGELSQGIYSASYQSSLAATLMESGNSPALVSFGNYESRVDPQLDSASARTATAQSALRQEVATAQRPVVAMLPAQQDSGKALLSTASELLSSKSAKALPLRDFLTSTSAQRNELAGMSPTDINEGATRFGAPFDDPTTIADTEILQTHQQADYIDNLTSLMVQDPNIALTPYGFTTPLRHDLLRALRYTGRDSLTQFDERVRTSSQILNTNRATLTTLRSSVSLLPPGNVYTRLSESSPLLIVAENGLPLPVKARISYQGPADSKLNIPSPLLIPAKGSITVNMTAQLPDDSEQTDLKLWLATPQGAQISDGVTIAVQTRSGLMGRSGLAFLVILALSTTLVIRLFRKQRKVRLANEASQPKTTPPPKAPVKKSVTKTPNKKRRTAQRRPRTDPQRRSRSHD